VSKGESPAKGQQTEMDFVGKKQSKGKTTGHSDIEKIARSQVERKKRRHMSLSSCVSDDT